MAAACSPNGKDCKYRHALPPGYVLRSQMKELLEAEAANVRHRPGPLPAEEQGRACCLLSACQFGCPVCVHACSVLHSPGHRSSRHQYERIGCFDRGRSLMSDGALLSCWSAEAQRGGDD